MASNTKETQIKRKNRHNRMNPSRKAALRNKGTTPVFPVHTPEADANAPAQAVPQAD